MDWSSVLVTGGMAAAAAALGWLLTVALKRLPGRWRHGAFMIAAVAPVPFFLWGLPLVHHWQQRLTAERVFDRNRVLTLLEKQHPEIRAQFTETMTRAMREGNSALTRQRGAGWGQQVLGKYVVDYLPRASDEALLDFVAATIELLDQLRQRPDDACFVFVFGSPEAKTQLQGSYPSELGKRLVAAQERVVESAIEHPEAAPDAAETDALTERMVTSALSKHGDEIAGAFSKLAQPEQVPEAERKRVCWAVRELFAEAVALPAPANARALRALVTRH